MRILFSTSLLFFLGTTAAATSAEKPEKWLEARSPHFIVVTREGEGVARQAARSAEQVRAVFHAAFPELRLDPPVPITLLGVRGEKSFRELVPEFWERKGGVHPSGVFASGPDRSFIALRLDVPGTEPSHIIAHEYAHVFLRLNSAALPLWLDEGLAEFFATVKVGGKEAQVGLPNPTHLRALRDAQLLPLDTFLAADGASPYYNDPKLASLFYAQSWLLTHQLVFARTGDGPSRLSVLLSLLAAGLDPREAQQRILGDPAKAQANLEAYLRDPAFKVLLLRISSEAAEREFSLRELSPAESAALRGMFLLYQDRPGEARGFLDEALRLDPHSATATEAMGIFFFRDRHDQEAATWFGRAVDLSSPSFLPYYYHAALRMRAPLDPASSASVERELRRSLELNPDYAPACEALATFYHGRGEQLEQALTLAQHAVDLEPRVAGHKLVMAGILLGLHRNLEAKLVAQSILDTSSSGDDRDAAKALLAAVRSTEKRPDVQLGPGGQISSRAVASQPAAGGRSGDAARASGKPGSSRAQPSGRKSSQPRQLSAQGTLLNVTCSSPAVMDLKLVTSKGTLSLHADNYFKVDFQTLRWKPPDPFRPCEHIQGRTARVVYTPVQDQGYQGEFSSLEVLK